MADPRLCVCRRLCHIPDRLSAGPVPELVCGSALRGGDWLVFPAEIARPLEDGIPPGITKRRGAPLLSPVSGLPPAHLAHQAPAATAVGHARKPPNQGQRALPSRSRRTREKASRSYP